MILQPTIDTWVDLNQVMAIHKIAVLAQSSDGPEIFAHYKVLIYTGFQLETPLEIRMQPEEWETFSAIWKDHVDFINGQEALMKEQALAVAALPSFEITPIDEESTNDNGIVNVEEDRGEVSSEV